MPVKVLLKEMRLKRGLSQNELARKIEMSLNAVQHLEYKAKAIQLDTLSKLCEVLNCQPGDLLVWIPNNDGSQESERQEEKLKELDQQGKSTEQTSPTSRRTRSVITVIPDVPESA